MKQYASNRAREIYETYARDISPADLQRLFTHDTRDSRFTDDLTILVLKRHSTPIS